MHNTELYLENTLIELTDAVHFAITKTFEDITNPTVIINDWSKSIDIPGTQANNQFFGHIYKPDMQIANSSSGHTYVNFDPTRKLDMRIVYDGQLLMSGYAKITQIKQNNGNISYNCTLNGQMGKIFQDFANIRFDLPTDSSTTEDIKYVIDTSVFFTEVMDCSHMNNLWMHDQVMRGVYDASDNINPYLKSYDIINFTPNNAYVDDFDYTTYQIDHNRAETFNERLEIGQPSLVSQIPADTIYPDGLKPREIGEYRTYNNLPFIYVNKLFQIVAHKGYELTGYRFALDSTWFRDDNPYWYKSIVYLQPLNYHNKDLSEDAKTNTYNKANVYTQMTGDSSAAYQNVYNTSIYANRTDGYTEEIVGVADWNGQGRAYSFFTSNNNGIVSISFDVYVSVAELDASELHFFYDSGLELNVNIRDDNGNIVKTCKALATSNMTTIDLTPYEYVFKFEKWENYQSVHQFRITLPFTVIFPINNITYGTKFSTDMECKWVMAPIIRPCPLYYDSAGKDEFYTNNYFYVQSSKPMTIKYQNMIRSGARYHLSDLWDHTYKPWDILLNYMKIFRMMIYIDESTKSIRFVPATQYFKQYQIEDWTNKLDMTKDFIIKPVYWGSNKVLFNLTDNETKIGSGYKEKYGVNYGEKQIITDYKFDTNTTNIFDKPIKNTIISTDNVLSWTATYDIGSISYTRPSTEVFPHFADEDNKLVNPFGSFAFALGNAMWDSPNGNLRTVILTDDTINQQLQGKYYYTQSSDQSCYLVSNGYPKVDIAKWRNIFTFGKPMENYSTTNYYTSGMNDIYGSFWENYINERYNVQSKMVTCYIDIKPIDYLNFKFNKFIKIDNQLYFVNKIYDYDIMSYATTKCDLITVRNISAYYRDNYQYIDGKLHSNTLSAGESTTIDIDCNGNGTWAIESPGVFDVLPPSGTGPTSGTITVRQNAPAGDYQIVLYRTDSPFSSLNDKEHVRLGITVAADSFTGLKFTANEPSSIGFSRNDRNLQYKVNTGEWTDYETANSSILLNEGDVIKWRRNASGTLNASLGNFIMDGSLSASGNVMSILNGSTFETMTSVGESAFFSLFRYCDALVTPPELPATSLSPQCYRSMFAHCSNLTTAPVLPATTLEGFCYYYMFGDCTSLVTPPDLPATRLESACYYAMFKNCINLKHIKCLATNNINDYNTRSWLNNVSASGTFTKATGATWPSGVDGIPNNWDVVEE